MLCGKPKSLRTNAKSNYANFSLICIQYHCQTKERKRETAQPVWAEEVEKDRMLEGKKDQRWIFFSPISGMGSTAPIALIGLIGNAHVI